MATIPAKERIPTQPVETVKDKFRRLESLWTAETGHLSSTTKIVNHPAFQEIIGLRPAVIPLMLRDLAERPRLWVWALPKITGIDLAPPSDGGNIAVMSQLWLDWATEHGYEW